MSRIFLYLWFACIVILITTMIIAPASTALVHVVEKVASRNAPLPAIESSIQNDVVATANTIDDEPVQQPSTTLQTLASGAEHTCVITQSAQVRCWGKNSAGQIGNGSDGAIAPIVTTPAVVSGLVDVASIALGDAHSCALRVRIGTVWCWGDNAFSQLGNNTYGPQTQQSLPQLVADVRDATQISAGSHHTCALLATGQVMCWGSNQSSQLAQPDITIAPRPVTVTLPLPAKYVAAGDSTSCAITTDDAVWCWGDNAQRQINLTEARILQPQQLATGFASNAVAVSATQICGIANSMVWCSSNGQIQSIPVTDVVQVRRSATGEICAITRGDALWCWSAAQAPVQQEIYGVVDVAGGTSHTCVLLRAAKIACRGDNAFGQLGVAAITTQPSFAILPLGQTGSMLSGGQGHFCALWQQGLVRCWGRNIEGQLGTPEQRDSAVPQSPDINGVLSVAVGGHHSCGVRYDKSVYCWGANDYGQLGINTLQRANSPQQIWSLPSVATVSAGLNHTCVRTEGGTVWCWGDNRHGQTASGNHVDTLPQAITELPPVIKIASGGNSNCALKYDGTVVCWGESISPGQSNFAVVPALQDVVDIHVGMQLACALQHSGQLLCWGDRSWTAATQPQPVSGMPPLVAFAVGGSHVCGIDRLRQLWCVGGNLYGQTQPSNADNMVSQPQKIMDGVSYVALGFATSCARLQSGKTTCWGDGSYGQLGTGAYAYDETNRFVKSINDGFGIAVGGNFTCALLEFVTARCWGGNEYGQLGDGTTNTASFPQSVRSNEEYVSIAAGSAHACAIVADGTVRCWGHNNFGQLGNEATEDSSTPVISAVQAVVDISLGQSHTCALLQDGGGACWGRNDDGQLGSGNTASSGMPLRVAELTTAIEIKSGGNHTCALLQDTTVRCWGRNQQGQLGIGDVGPGVSVPVSVPGLVDVVHLSLGLDHSCAVTTPGAVYCWGWNRYGQVGMGTVGESAYVTRPQLIADVSDVAQVTTGDNHTCVLQHNGDVRCWGDNFSGQLGTSELTGATANTTQATKVNGISNVVAIAAGGAHTCALLQRGDVACWGWNNVGQIGNGSGGTYQDVAEPRPIVGRLGAVSVAVADHHICMADAIGTVWCWGENTFGQLGIGSDLGTSTRALPSEVDAATNTAAVAVGDNHTCALLVTNDLNCWGRNTIGQLGNSFSGDLADSPVPYFVGNFTGVTAFAVGGNQSCAIRAAQVYCWGDNQYGQIATTPTGIGEFRTTPTAIQLDGVPVDLVVGATHVCALREDGRISCWGRNNQYQLGNADADMSTLPTLVPNVAGVVALAAGDNHTCAVTTTGNVWCWGSNQFGQLGVVGETVSSPQQVPDITDAIGVAAGKAHTCVITRKQTITCWGDNTHMQLGTTDLTAANATVQLKDVPRQIAAGGDRTCVIAQSTAVWCWGQNEKNLLGVTANPDRNVPVMVQQLWEMRVEVIALVTPTPVPTRMVFQATTTPRPTRVALPTTTLIKRTMPTPAFTRVPLNDTK